jgi:hypothetical protein
MPGFDDYRNPKRGASRKRGDRCESPLGKRSRSCNRSQSRSAINGVPSSDQGGSNAVPTTTFFFSAVKKVLPTSSFREGYRFFPLPLFFLVIPAALAPPLSATCFDFTTKVDQPLKKPFAYVKPQDPKVGQGGEVRRKGKLPTGVVWAGVRQSVAKPLQEVLEMLLDHETTAGKERAKDLKLKELKDSKYLARHRATFTLKPFLFFTVEWTEDWGYAVTDGSREKPNRVVISYEKTSGTSHISHLCGNIVLEKTGPAHTDVFLYEEAKATNRSEDDTERGLQGTLAELMKRGPAT